MPFSIQLRFDSESNRRILYLAEQIEKLGIVNPFVTHKSIPHIALCIFDDLNLEQTVRFIDKFKYKKIDVKFCSLACFSGTENVLFLSPIPNIDLINIHSEVCNGISRNGRLWAYYNEENWVPHSTVGIDIPPEKFGVAFTVVQKVFVPFSAGISEISVTSFRPSTTLYTKNFASGSKDGVG